MTSVRLEPGLIPALRAAMEHRYAELDGVPSAVPPSSVSDEDAEEALRQIMVRYRPRIARKEIAEESLPGLIAALERAAARAGWDDVRFVDAFNALYESWEPAFHPEMRRRFLALYRSALERLIRT